MKKLLLFIIVLISTIPSYAQIGGDHIFEFLNTPPSARVTALGGTLITVKDDDAALAYENPAVLNPLMHNQLSINHNFHLDGISNGFVNYARYVDQWETTFHAGMKYISYGSFDSTDEYGNINGSFKANEYAFNIGAGKQLYDKLSVGANIKLIGSQFESYFSSGIGVDLGAFYQDTSKLRSFALVLKNVGAQMKTYNDTREPLPFDMQFAISQQLRHLPFRFTATFHNLHRWNILYDDPNSEEDTFFLDPDQANSQSQFSINVDNFFRHLNFSGEFLLGKSENFRIRFGYSHLRRKELTVDNFRSLAGFTGGIGMKINRFRIEYGRAFYHIAGGLNHFSLSTNLGSFKK